MPIGRPLVEVETRPNASHQTSPVPSGRMRDFALPLISRAIRAAFPSPDTPKPPGSIRALQAEATTCRDPGTVDFPGFLFVAVKTLFCRYADFAGVCVAAATVALIHKKRGCLRVGFSIGIVLLIAKLIGDFPIKASQQHAEGPLPSQSKKCETTTDRPRLHANLDRGDWMPLGPIAGDRLHPDLSRKAFRT